MADIAVGHFVLSLGAPSSSSAFGWKTRKFWIYATLQISTLSLLKPKLAFKLPIPGKAGFRNIH
jgi:hypothetical protein